MLELKRSDAGWDDAARAYKVIIDGKEAGKILKGQTLQFDLAPGHHTLRLKIDWCSSRELIFDVAEGKTVYAECAPAKKPALIGPLLYIIFKTRQYIDLEMR